MKKLITVLALALAGVVATTSVAHAANAACETQATEKKLAGAAKNSFVKKCVKDAG